MRTIDVRTILTWRMRAVIEVLALMLCLLAPAASMAQGIKDAANEDPATEEPEQVGPCVSTSRDDTTDAEDAGLMTARTYESPQFGYEVEWTQFWQLDDSFDSPVLSSPEQARDALCLIWLPDDETFAYIHVSGQVESRGGPRADVEEWTDPDFIEQEWPDLEVDILLDDSSRRSGAVVYALYNPETDVQHYVMYEAIELADDSMLYLTFAADDVSFEDALESVTTEVWIDGDPIFDTFDWDDIEEAIDRT